MAGLTLRKQAFVHEYMRNGGNATQAAIGAGYAYNNARTQGYRLVNHDDAVKKELERARAELAERTDYDAEQAMTELGTVIEFARETKNATAMARGVELRMRMAGLLVDKHELNVQGNVDITGALIDARMRSGIGFEDEDEDDVLEGEYSEPGALPAADSDATEPDIFN